MLGMEKKAVWFTIVKTDGQPLTRQRLDRVFLSPSQNICDLQNEVKRRYNQPDYLEPFPSSELEVFRNMEERSNNENALFSNLEIGVLGHESTNPLVISLPSSVSPPHSGRSAQSEPCLQSPKVSRKRRWDKLNEVLLNIAKRTKNSNSTAYSNVGWSDVESVFELESYEQVRTDIPADRLDILHKYLSYVSQCCGSLIPGNEAKRLQFISPIIVCVCSLLSDVKLYTEEELVGSYVRAHGRFEFMIRRGKKVICIVEAKKENLEQGMAQDLIGCEVAAELGGLDVVYGIVTNYVEWIFLRNDNERIALDHRSLCVGSGIPDMESLKSITGRIYSLLLPDNN